ncbi:MAG: hypothetical protein AAGL49_08325 [Pseudomonadota bacterium]
MGALGGAVEMIERQQKIHGRSDFAASVTQLSKAENQPGEAPTR